MSISTTENTLQEPLKEKKYNYYISFDLSDVIATGQINGLPLPEGSGTQFFSIDWLITHGSNTVTVNLKSNKANAPLNSITGRVRIVRTDSTAPEITFTSDIEKAFLVKDYIIPPQLNKNETSISFDFSAESNIVFPWLTGKTITDTPDIKNRLLEKYQELWDAFNMKDKEKINTLLKQKNDFWAVLLGDPNFTSRLMSDLEQSFSKPQYSLYSFSESKEYAHIVIAADGKLVTLSTEDAGEEIFSPIFYLNSETNGSKQYTFYFMLNDKEELILIY